MIYEKEENRPKRHELERNKIARTYLDQGIWSAFIQLQLSETELSCLGKGELFDLELFEGLRIQASIGRTCSVNTLLVETVFYTLEGSPGKS